MKNVLYVPLDDRPVNLDDVILLGKAAGLNLITPNAADIRNRIDSQKTTSGNQITGTSIPTFGNPSAVRQFILNQAANVEGFIISIDMLAYGGLIGSRRLRSSGGGTYPSYDAATTNLLDVIRLIKQSYPSKPVYVLDTIMRLATNTFIEGVTYADYSNTRTFMGQPRQTFTSSMSFNQILNGYNLDPNGNNYGAVPNIPNFNKDHYYYARQHKFKTNYYVLDQLARLGYIDFLAIGADDGKKTGVQINEIRFVEQFINNSLGGSGGQNANRAIILPDADGLGHALVGRMANQLYRGGSKPKYMIRYYGPNGSTIDDAYEYMDVHTNMLRHIDVIGGQHVASSADVEIIAITAENQASSAIAQINTNGTNRKATVVIDFTSSVANAAVTEALLGSQNTGRLLGYCAWNTSGNRIGISLGMGQARYAYLVTETQAAALNAAVNAHGSLLFKRFLKDYYYKTLVMPEVRERANEEGRKQFPAIDSNQGMNMSLYLTNDQLQTIYGVMRNRMQTHITALRAKSAFLIGNSATAYNVKQINGATWSFAGYASASLDYNNPAFIWMRPNEITLGPVVTLQ